MRLHLNPYLRSSVIYSWYMAWALITAMPVIHAHMAMMKMFHGMHSITMSISSTNMPISSTKTNTASTTMSTSSTKTPLHGEVYQCPLCHCADVLFDSDINIALVSRVSIITDFYHVESFHFLALLFKPARSPPTLFA